MRYLLLACLLTGIGCRGEYRLQSTAKAHTPAVVPAVAIAATVAPAVVRAPGTPANWPDALDFPSRLVPYTHSSYTQEIAVTNGFDRITPVHRGRLDEAWRVPGGLAGVSGWQSELYAAIAPGSSQWIGEIQVKNSFGFFQPNRGWRRSFADGTLFADVLSKAGKVFQVRYLEKESGQWAPHIAYRDPENYPVGFVAFKSRQCMLCHGQSGQGGYALGLVPGGDGILSYPFNALER